MNEVMYKKRVAAAIWEPRAPDDLVERTVMRGQCLIEGRAAQRRLAELKGTPPNRELQRLAAQSVVGQLMQTTELPQSVSGREMVELLLQDADFVQVLTRPADELLQALHTGELLRDLVGEESPEHLATPQPKKSVRDKGGPQL
ncbi:MAG: hypothetical protein MJ073_03600 [Oscillibacter sp.]|nr:hypothetical protein [Oscillibacter sp.]